ncbi:MAG: efflux RND transporter periplasmic adaptor subunit [Proteobacteria bacterium]|nr:efflux RND transporter periplasmic adaptor subunit [Pseudomonadota bacterium]
MKLRNLIFIIIAVIVTSFIIYKQFQTPSVKVKKIDVKAGEVVKSVSASGFIKSNLETEIAFPISGRVNKVYFNEGDTVAQGALIAKLNNDDLYFTAESARKDKDATQRTRDIYKENYQFSTKEVGGQAEYDLNIRKLTDQLRSADNSYKATLSNLNKSYLYSPLTGTIVYSDLKEGKIGGSATTVKIADLSKLEFQADLDQEDFKFVKAGQTAEIVLDAYPESKFLGKLVFIPSYVDEESATKTFKLKIALDSQNNNVVKGMTGDVNIITNKIQAKRYLPFDAVFSEEDKRYVWSVNEDGKLSKLPVEIGLEGDTFTEIKSNLPEFVVIPDSSVKTVKEGYFVTY